MAPPESRRRNRWPWHGWLGLALVAAAWPATWALPGPRTHILFFPLWLGFVLTVDALVARRRGDSILIRAPLDFALLFLASIPAWWLFELLNRRLRNWEYLGGESITGGEYLFWSSLSFSTVIPAVFEAAELLRTTRWIERFRSGPRIRRTPRLLATSAVAGALMLALTLAWPRTFFPFVWLSLIFLLEPACAMLGRRSLLTHLAGGDWRPLVALALGALLCGFFWELWNYWSYPKWVYHVPFVGIGHVFEMPLAGYLGYLPFGLELYSLAHLLLPRPPGVQI